jgi:recombination protein RecA
MQEDIPVAFKKSASTPALPAGERVKAIQAALAQVQKDYGTEALVNLAAGARTPVAGLSTGSLSLDEALGGKGLPRGRVVELYGPESSGKSTLAMSVIAQAQKHGGFALYIDAEHAFDPEYAQKLGVKVSGEQFLLAQPSTGEEGLDIAEQFIKSGAVDVIVVDSVAALVPKAEMEGDIGDTFVGVQARMMSQALRRLTSIIGKSNTVVIFINQLREKIGVMFGNPETTPGGRALKFYSSVRMDVRRIGSLKEGEEQIGNRTKVTVVKNKVAPPFRRAEFDILYGSGISLEGDVLDLGMLHEIVKKSGAWLSYSPPGREELRLGNGREAARKLLLENPELRDEIAATIRAKLSSGITPMSVAVATGPAKAEEAVEAGGGKFAKTLARARK